MPRSLWTGSVAFGLVNIPVRLVTAVRSKSIQFDLLNEDGTCRLRRKLYCPETGEEYDFKDTARGYEISPDQYILIKDEELEQLKPEKGRTIDISEFVDLAEIDPIYFDRTYYLLPDEGGAKAYRLLVEAMGHANKVGVASFVMRQKEYLVALRVHGGALQLHTMHWADEVTGVDDLGDDLPGDVQVNAKEQKVAEQLIAALTTEFDPQAHKDDYREQVEALIEKKAEGEGVKSITTREEESPPPTYNLMEALKRSVENKGGARKKSGRKKSA